MNNYLAAMKAASPYHGAESVQPPAHPSTGQIHVQKNDRRPANCWAVLCYDGAAWVCIGQGPETWQQAANRSWALHQAQMMSVGPLAS